MSNNMTYAITPSTEINFICIANPGLFLLDYQLYFQANFSGFSPTVPKTGFPFFLGTSL